MSSPGRVECRGYYHTLLEAEPGGQRESTPEVLDSEVEYGHLRRCTSCLLLRRAPHGTEILLIPLPCDENIPVLPSLVHLQEFLQNCPLQEAGLLQGFQNIHREGLADVHSASSLVENETLLSTETANLRDHAPIHLLSSRISRLGEGKDPDRMQRRREAVVREEIHETDAVDLSQTPVLVNFRFPPHKRREMLLRHHIGQEMQTAAPVGRAKSQFPTPDQAHVRDLASRLEAPELKPTKLPRESSILFTGRLGSLLGDDRLGKSSHAVLLPSNTNTLFQRENVADIIR